MKLLFVDLYCTINHVNAKNELPLKKKEKVALKGFSQAFFMFVYCQFVLGMVWDCYFFPLFVSIASIFELLCLCEYATNL